MSLVWGNRLQFAQQLDFGVSSDRAETGFDTSLCTISITGANMTVTRSDGIVVGYISEGGSSAITLRADFNYTATVWQTDTDTDDFLVCLLLIEM